MIYNLEAESAQIKSVLKENDEEKELKEMGQEFWDKVIRGTELNPRIIPAKVIDTILTRVFGIALVGIIFILVSFVLVAARRRVKTIIFYSA